MNLLAIDTSTDTASVALLTKGNLYYEEQGAQRQHAALILPMIEQLLAKSGLGLKELDGLVYGRGPGSFTGLRIACSVAKGLAYSQDLPLYPVSSLAAIAQQVRESQDYVIGSGILALLDARMKQLYWAYFADEQVEVEEIVSDPADLLFNSDQPLILAGLGYEPYLPDFPAALQAKAIKQISVYPRADAMINLVLTGKIKAVSAAEALPVYIRNKIT